MTRIPSYLAALLAGWLGTYACSAKTITETTPHPVTFLFENTSNAPVAVALGGSCGGHFVITAAADGYRQKFITFAPCGVVCPKVATCSDGACVPEPVPVVPGSPAEEHWDGYEYRLGRNASGDCTEKVVASTGSYRITVPVYRPGPFPTDPGQGLDTTPDYDVVVDFSLPVPGGVVHVPLDRRPAGVDSGGEPIEEGCIPIVARAYDTGGDCYAPKATLPDVCLRETAPDTTTGLTEIACLSAPDGKSYAIVKGYTQCLVTKYAGWSAEGDAGLCEAQPTGDCAAAVSRGYWSLGVFGPQTLDFATDADAGGPRGDRVGECERR